MNTATSAGRGFRFVDDEESSPRQIFLSGIRTTKRELARAEAVQWSWVLAGLCVWLAVGPSMDKALFTFGMAFVGLQPLVAWLRGHPARSRPLPDYIVSIAVAPGLVATVAETFVPVLERYNAGPYLYLLGFIGVAGYKITRWVHITYR